MVIDLGITTYILRCDRTEELYCGKTNNLSKTLLEHAQGKNGDWFIPKRRMFHVIYKIDGDFEENIKHFGIDMFIYCLERGFQ